VSTLIVAGDIGDCGSEGDQATASLVAAMPGRVATLGDNAYPDGSESQFRQCYGPTWGRFKGRTRSTPGNHDYQTLGATGYFEYFGSRAGPAGRGYYSYDLGAWHVISLNSNCADAGGCEAGSPQERWLAQDLAEHPSSCTLAMWHHPRFSSGSVHADDPATQAFWDDLYAAGTEVVLSAHEHSYERFAPQDPQGNSDPGSGIREFVVGTGGAVLYPFGPPDPNSKVRVADSWGVLRLRLSPTRYRWTFVTVDGRVRDSGGDRCG
jgi:acid phosphatase type 7